MIELTSAAAQRIIELLDGENEKIPGVVGLRIAVEGGGCSGFMYKFSYAEDKDALEDDTIIKKDGAELYVDPISGAYLEDSLLDFVESLEGSHFAVSNPNVTSKCGCGSSFSV